FFSKDEIIGAAYERSKLLAVIMLFTAFLTAYYTFRLYFRVFEGPEILPEPPKNPHGHDIDEHLAHDNADHGHATAGHDSHGHGDHDDHHHNHEPALMMVPLVVLALGAILAGA